MVVDDVKKEQQEKARPKIKNKIENIEDIKKFDKDGYGFAEEMSLENKFVFVKNI